MNSETIYVFDPLTSVASHSGNSEGVLYVSAPHSTTARPTLQIFQGTMLPPAPSGHQDSIPGGSHVLSVNAYPVSYTVIPSSSQAYDVNCFDLARYVAFGTPISAAGSPFAHPFASQGHSPSPKTVPLYLLNPLGQEQQHSPSHVNPSFNPGYAYLEPPYMGHSPQIRLPHTTAATASASSQLDLMPQIDQSRLTMLPVSAPSPAHPLMAPQKAWAMPKTSLGKTPESASPSQALGLREGASSSNLPYSLAKRSSSSSTVSVAQPNSSAGAEMYTKSANEPRANRDSLVTKEKKELTRFMGVRGFLAPPPLGIRIVPGTTTLLDIPRLALPEPTWGILPQAALLAE